MIINTSETKLIRPFLERLYIPPKNSHKGQNGKVLIIGGSKLFHAASLWAAELASHFVDIVHYSSTIENNEIFLSLKKKFRNGMVVTRKDLSNYIREDDCILVGPGMVRKKVISYQLSVISFLELFKISDEAEYTYRLTKYLIENFPDKRFVFDAGALQMMEKEWLLKLKTQAIITPHQGEFKRLFDIDLGKLSVDQKKDQVEATAKKYNCTILLKAVIDIISNGEKTVIIEGGNCGLTKGGTGDVLAGLTASFYTKNNTLESAILASFLLKKAADELFKTKGYWYNISDLITVLPNICKQIIL